MSLHPQPGSSTCPICGGEHEPVTIAGVRVLPCPEVPSGVVGITAPPVDVQPLHTPSDEGASGCRYCGRGPVVHEGRCDDCTQRVMARFCTPPLHTSQVLAWVRDPDWTHKPADPPGCVE